MHPSIHHQLRESTSVAHENVERALDLEMACRDEERYRNTLAAFLGYYEPLEKRLASKEGWMGYQPEDRRKSPWLKRDLQALHLSPEELSILPRCRALPELATLAQAYGCAYVLEGATLGGRQISQWLAQTAIPLEARTFFASYGAEVGGRWKEFCAALESFATQENEAEILEGARETFSTLSHWMELRNE